MRRATAHAPNLFARRKASSRQLIRQFVVVREHARIFVPKTNDDGTCQGRKINHELRFESVLAVPKHIRQNEAPLGVRIVNLDRLTRHGRNNITRPLRIAVRHIFHQADQTNRVYFRFTASERLHQSGDRAGAAHIPFHVLHAGPGLQRDTAGIESHALADECNWLFGFGRSVPSHNGDLAFTNGPLADAQERTHAKLLHLFLAKNLDLNAQFRKGLHLFRKTRRVEDIRWLRDEIAGKENAVRDLLERTKRPPGSRRSLHAKGKHLQRRFRIDFFFRPILVEAIAPEQRAVGYIRRRARQIATR